MICQNMIALSGDLKWKIDLLHRNTSYCVFELPFNCPSDSHLVSNVTNMGLLCQYKFHKTRSIPPSKGEEWSVVYNPCQLTFQIILKLISSRFQFTKIGIHIVANHVATYLLSSYSTSFHGYPFTHIIHLVTYKNYTFPI